MPTTTPALLDARLHRGALRVTVADVPEITVEVVGRAADVRIDRSSDGRHVTIAPTRSGIGRHPRVDLDVRVPLGTHLRVSTASAEVTTTGTLRSADCSSASGSVRLDEVDEDLRCSSASGSLRAVRVGGPITFTSASGSLQVDRTGPSCSAQSASGSVTVGLAGGDVSATTVSGGVVVREAHVGTLDLSSTSGSVTVGVRRGTLTWLDVSSMTGRVRSDLQDEPAAGAADGPHLTVRANSMTGGVTVSSTGTPAIAL